MSRIQRSSDGFQPDCRSSWQRDRASAPFEVADNRAVRDAIVCAVLVAIVAFVGIFVL